MAKFANVAEYLGSLPEPLNEVGRRAQEVIDSAVPEATGAIWHGHPVWSLGEKPGTAPVCLLKAHKEHVTFGLWRGQNISDPSGRLEPGAREMANVKLRTDADIDPELFTDWLRQAYKFESTPGADS